jgi:alpha-tubulin suppressor-like RCC1 family protein
VSTARALPKILLAAMLLPVVHASVPIEPLGMVEHVAAGTSHACAVDSLGVTRCWGWNITGQTGIGETGANAPLAMRVLGIGEPVAQVAAGMYHTCARTVAGAVHCWGAGGWGQLGDLSGTSKPHAVRVAGLDSVADIATGDDHTCAVTDAGSLWCWGVNGSGQLGDGTWFTRARAERVELPHPVVSVAAGGLHTCAALSDGSVYCWGDNYYAQLGDGTRDPRMPFPAPVAGLGAAVVELAAAGAHTCGRLADSRVQCWGLNNMGQLGAGTDDFASPVPLDVVGLQLTPVSLRASGGHTCALDGAGRARCWGNNSARELGGGSEVGTRGITDVTLVNDILGFATGSSFSCAMTGEGSVHCWGANQFAQLGRNSWGSIETDAMPVLVVREHVFFDGFDALD